MTEHGGLVLRIERTFDAPAEEVFDAWTSEEVLLRWWHADPEWETPSAEVDLRVGGKLRIVMRNPMAGADYGGGGEYTVIDRPHRLALSWIWDDDPSGGIDDRSAASSHATLQHRSREPVSSRIVSSRSSGRVAGRSKHHTGSNAGSTCQPPEQTRHEAARVATSCAPEEPLLQGDRHSRAPAVVTQPLRLRGRPCGALRRSSIRSQPFLEAENPSAQRADKAAGSALRRRDPTRSTQNRAAAHQQRARQHRRKDRSDGRPRGACRDQSDASA
jgi:uncharacterized protein YndB with AHSA1/START domain